MTVLLIEDDAVDAEWARRALADPPEGSRSVDWAQTLADARVRLKEGDYDVVLSDMSLPDGFGGEIHDAIRKMRPGLPVVYLTGTMEEKAAAIEALRLGAQDYLIKGTVSAAELRRALEFAIERQQLMSRLAAHARELERSNRDLEQFASVAAHDLRSPLRKISAFIEILSERLHGKLDDESRDLMARVTRSAERMESLTESLLNYARLGRADRAAHEVVAMDTVLAEALEGLECEIARTAAKLETNKLPRVMGDQPRLVQLLSNLLSNALKFHRPSSPPMIRIETVRRKGRWVFRIADNGIGIPEGMEETVFELFNRLHSDAEYPGLGMGLSTCRKVVHQHGGEIHIEALPKGGTAVVFSLPAAPRKA